MLQHREYDVVVLRDRIDDLMLDIDADGEVGIARHQFAGDGTCMMRAEFIRRFDAQGARDGRVHRQRFAAGIVQRCEQRLYPAIDGLAGVGEAQMPRGALDKTQAEVAFQPLHCSAKARFGMAQHARGGRKSTVLDDFAE